MYNQVSLKLIKDPSGSQNTLLRLKPSPKHQPQIFISRQQRFVSKPIDPQPGPGAYIDPMERSRLMEKEKQEKSPKRQVNENHLDSFVSREHQWIFGSDRLKYGGQGSGLGPGAYNVGSSGVGGKGKESWGKANRFNGTEWSQPQAQSLGPGTYQLQKNPLPQRPKASSVFKSKTPKTFLQQLTHNLQKQTHPKSTSQFQPLNSDIQQLQKLATSQQPSNDKKPKPDPIFLSKSKRYQFTNPQSNNSIGPGSYQLASLDRQLLKHKVTKLKAVSTSSNNIRKQPKKSDNAPIPGPASYDLMQYSLQQQVNKKITSLKGNMALDTRFKSFSLNNSKKQSTTLPGPGHYNRQRYLFIDQKQYQHKPLVNHHDKVQVPFLSFAQRVSQEQRQSPFGQYNLNQFDMAEKAKKKRHHIQKLKAMDISVPGFESAERRTVFNLGKMAKEHFVKVNLERHRELQRNKSKEALGQRA